MDKAHIYLALTMSAIGYLSTRGFTVAEVTIKHLLGAAYKDFLNKLTLVVRNRVGPATYARSYSYELIAGTRCIVLPRSIAFKMERMMTVRVMWADPIRIDAPMTGAMFDNQRIILDYLMEHVYTYDRISSGRASTILNLRAGMGKTYLACGLIARLQVKSLYIVPKISLMTQTIDNLRTAIGCTVGQYKAGKPIPDIMVIVINSALKLPKTIIDQFSLVLLDECHEYCSEGRRKIFRIANLRMAFGMSATTENRRDKLDRVVHRELLVDDLIRAENIPSFTYEDVIFTGTAHVIKYYGPPEFAQTIIEPATNMVSTKKTRDLTMEDPWRNQMTLDRLTLLYNTGHYVYVFCEEKAPMRRLYDLLATRFEVDAPELEGILSFNGDTKQKDIEKIKRDARVLLTTFSYSGTGVSIEKMTAIIFYSSRRSNMLQIIPRILRRGSDCSIRRHVYDIVDANTALAGQYRERHQAYDYYGFDIEVEKIKHTEIVLV